MAATPQPIRSLALSDLRSAPQIHLSKLASLVSRVAASNMIMSGPRNKEPSKCFNGPRWSMLASAALMSATPPPDEERSAVHRMPPVERLPAWTALKTHARRHVRSRAVLPVRVMRPGDAFRRLSLHPARDRGTHQRPWRLESTKSHAARRGHRRQRVDPAEASQPVDVVTTRRRLPDVREPRVELDESRPSDPKAKNRGSAVTDK